MNYKDKKSEYGTVIGIGMYHIYVHWLKMVYRHSASSRYSVLLSPVLLYNEVVM
jgi:hypothetical protein